MIMVDPLVEIRAEIGVCSYCTDYLSLVTTLNWLSPLSFNYYPLLSNTNYLLLLFFTNCSSVIRCFPATDPFQSATRPPTSLPSGLLLLMSFLMAFAYNIHTRPNVSMVWIQTRPVWRQKACVYSTVVAWKLFAAAVFRLTCFLTEILSRRTRQIVI